MPSNSVQGAGGLYGRLVSTRPQGASKFRSMRSDLRVFGAADLYGYACPEGSRNPRLASGADLVARAELRVGDWMRNTSERSAAERLCSRAREIFGDELERRRYDEYLQWCDLKAVFDDLEARMDPAPSSCTDEDVAPEIARLRELLGSRSQAEALMESYLANRGIGFVDARDAQISTAQGRAQVREELAAANLLPDSALQPSTPAPPTTPIAVSDAAAMQVAQAQYRQRQSGLTQQIQQYQPAQPQPAQQTAGAQVGVIRRCSCGNLNSAEQGFCQACGRPLDGTTTIPPIARGVPAGGGPVSPVVPIGPGQAGGAAAAEKRFPVAAVVVSLVFILVIAGALAFFFASGMADDVFGGKEDPVSEVERNTKRIQSGYTKAVACSSKTIISAFDVDEEPLESFTVHLEPKGGGISIDDDLLVQSPYSGRAASFTIDQFNGSNGRTLEDVPDGTYEVTITSKMDDDDTVCTFTAEYRASNKNAESMLEVVATK